MSAESDVVVPMPTYRRRRFLPPVAWLGIAAAAIAVVSAVRIWTGADNLDSSGAIQAAITAAVPIALAGLVGSVVRARGAWSTSASRA